MALWAGFTPMTDDHLNHISNPLGNQHPSLEGRTSFRYRCETVTTAQVPFSPHTQILLMNTTGLTVEGDVIETSLQQQG